MAHFNFVISQNAKWSHAGFYIDCHRMTVPENILLQIQHCLKRYNSDIPVHINCYYTVHKASKSNLSKPPIEFTDQKVCLPGMFP